MPDVKRIRIPETVKSALHGGILDLLPPKLADNDLVHWIVEFDSSLNSRTHEADDSFHLRKDREHWMEALIGKFGSALLQSRIPFYFASVFHIGRMMVVSAESLERIGVLRQPSNLDTSVAKIVTTFENQKAIPKSLASNNSVRQALLDGCDRASSQQSQQADLANRWWKYWQMEVENLRNSVEEFKQGWRYRNESNKPWRMAEGVFRLWRSTAMGTLQSEMARSGVVFKNLEAPTAIGSGLKLLESNPILLLAAIAFFGEGRGHPEPWFHFEYLVEQWLRVELAKANAEEQRVDLEKSEIALQLLQRKYDGINPFDQFAVGVTSATSRLRDLVKEHSLPNGSLSPWREVWQEQLLVIHSYNQSLTGSGSTDEELRKWCFRTADSAIKHNIDESGAQQLPWKTFVQRLFETKWVVEIAKMARNTNKNSNSKAWATTSVSELVSQTVEDLKKIGYELEVPASSRIELLLKKLEKGDSIYDSTEW